MNSFRSRKSGWVRKEPPKYHDYVEVGQKSKQPGTQGGNAKGTKNRRVEKK